MAVGKNTLGSMMAKISTECELTKRYTNHCIRSTCITALDDSGIETRHIMGLSGHKSESAVRSYSKRLSEKKKREMSDVLSSTVKSSTCTENAAPSTVPVVASVASNPVVSASGPVDNIPDFLDDDFGDYALANVLNDITNYELVTYQFKTMYRL